MLTLSIQNYLSYMIILTPVEKYKKNTLKFRSVQRNYHLNILPMRMVKPHPVRCD